MTKTIPSAREIALGPTPHAYRYSFCTLVTNLDEYQELLQSLQQSGFTPDICEYLYVNNSAGNRCDAYAGLNVLLNAARGQYAVLCHQDICLQFDGWREMEAHISYLDKVDPHWGVFGNAGISSRGEPLAHISHADGEVRWGVLPARCASLDENLLVVKRETGVRFAADLSAFHLYGTDVCQTLKQLGYTAWVVDFHLLHKSKGRTGADFVRAARAMEAKLREIHRVKWIYTMCATLYLGTSSFCRGFNDFRRLYYAKKNGYIPSIGALVEGPPAARWHQFSLMPVFWLLHRVLRPFENIQRNLRKWKKKRALRGGPS